MSVARTVSLKWKLFGLVGLLFVFVAAQAGLDLTDHASHAVTVSLLAASVLVVGSLAYLLRYMGTGFEKINARLEACATATSERLLPALQALAAGDLTVELHASTASAAESSHDELGAIMGHIETFRAAVLACYYAYNESTDKLRDLIGNVSSTASSVDSASHEMSSTSEETGKATGEIAQAISDVAQGAERQARMAEDAQRSAHEIAHAVSESAENAERAAEVARNAHEAAQQGVEAAQQASGAMQSVRESSRSVTEAIGELASKSEQIGVIVETITGIAEQTNLLALNAAIEAARAGEQGRGFAVVAEEVRKLAEESQRAAGEISGLIGGMQEETRKAVAVVEDGSKKTQDGSAVVEQTREAFLAIGSAVEDMNSRIEQIAAAAEQITATADAVQRSVGEVAAVAEQSSASTEEVSASTEETSASAQQIAASAHELATNAEALNGLVRQFKLTN
jgi:methyl-accepting chemotaxis protein